MIRILETPMLVLSFFFSSTLLLIDPNMMNMITTIGSLGIALILNVRRVLFNLKRLHTLITNWKRGMDELERDFKERDFKEKDGNN